MQLYQIADTYTEFLMALEDGGIPLDAAADTLSSIEGEFDHKADSIACLIKQIRAEADAIKAEAERLTERARSKAGRADWLCGYLLEQMQRLERKKIETARNVLTVSRNPDRVEITNEDFLLSQRPDLFVATAPRPDKAAIKELLKSGAVLPGAELASGYRLGVK